MHVRVITEGIPETHEHFVKWLRSRKYPLQGKLVPRGLVMENGKLVPSKEMVPMRSGTCSPIVNETKMYDIQIKSDCKNHLLSDLKHFTWVGQIEEIDRKQGNHLDFIPITSGPKNGKKTWKMRLFQWMIKKIGFTPVDMSKVEFSKCDWEGFAPYYYIVILGSLNDRIEKDGVELL